MNIFIKHWVTLTTAFIEGWTGTNLPITKVSFLAYHGPENVEFRTGTNSFYCGFFQNKGMFVKKLKNNRGQRTHHLDSEGDGSHQADSSVKAHLQVLKDGSGKQETKKERTSHFYKLSSKLSCFHSRVASHRHQSTQFDCLTSDIWVCYHVSCTLYVVVTLYIMLPMFL